MLWLVPTFKDQHETERFNATALYVLCEARIVNLADLEPEIRVVLEERGAFVVVVDMVQKHQKTPQR